MPMERARLHKHGCTRRPDARPMVESQPTRGAPATSACQRSSSTRSLHTAPLSGRWAEAIRSWKRNADSTTKRGVQSLSWRCASPAGCHQKSERQRQRQRSTVESARARPSGHERDAERTERACADCAAAGGRRTGDRKGGCLRTEAGERTPTAAQPPRQSVVSAATTQKRFLLDFVPKGQRHRPPRAASLSVLCCSKSVTFMENGPEGGMRAAGSMPPSRLAN